MRKYVYIYTKKYDRFKVHCLFKTLTKSNNIKYNRLPPRSYEHYLYCLSTKSILNRINKDRDNLSKKVEMRNKFVSFSCFMTYNHYLKQKKTMCEIKLNQILNRNPSLINLLNRDLPHPMNNHFIRFEEEEEDID